MVINSSPIKLPRAKKNSLLISLCLFVLNIKMIMFYVENIFLFHYLAKALYSAGEMKN